jgi:dihydrodipicolinate synthase/N-acetylneuraminate lyase
MVATNNSKNTEAIELLSSPPVLPRLWCPLLTQYDGAGRIDQARMRAHLTHLRPHVSAFLLPGSTGDGWQLSPDETRIVVDFGLDLAEELGLTLLLGALTRKGEDAQSFIADTVARIRERTGASDTGTALRSARVAGFTVCPPTGADLSPESIEAALESVLAPGYPTALYQLPQITANVMPPEMLSGLAARYPNFVMFKDSSGDDTVALSGADFGAVFLVRGAEGDYARWMKPNGPYDGFLLSTANSFPAELAAIVEGVAAGESDDVAALSESVSGCVKEVFARVAALPHGNPFTNANKAFDHFMAYGPDRALLADTPLPVLYGGASLPHEVLIQTADALTRWGRMPEQGYLDNASS